MTEFAYITDGYRCPDCGQWIYNSVGHACPNISKSYYSPALPYLSWPAYINPADISRIADALERIAKALEDKQKEK